MNVVIVVAVAVIIIICIIHHLCTIMKYLIGMVGTFFIERTCLKLRSGYGWRQDLKTKGRGRLNDSANHNSIQVYHYITTFFKDIKQTRLVHCRHKKTHFINSLEQNRILPLL
ncbi:hypothetical protein BDA99DRAFT_568815 [Phascolomyces articulosus]|uniref:Uncharacterized protein n=1 Tax=Phascolomyces articulosus TaxID=60185 RepID=A0AAD5PI58_9FUNG|nr:hypothetical protein BDA99DRAFT_568815 [Phascolomyces articulosus]